MSTAALQDQVVLITRAGRSPATALATVRELIAYNICVHTFCLSQPFIPGGTLSELDVILCSPEAVHLAGQVYQVGSHL
jgi:hypothetical protein